MKITRVPTKAPAILRAAHNVAAETKREAYHVRVHFVARKCSFPPPSPSPLLAPSALSHAFVSIVLRHRKSPRNLFRIRHGEADRFTLPFDRYDWILRFSTSLILASNHNRNQKASQLQQNTSQLFVTKIYNKRKILRVNFQSSN